VVACECAAVHERRRVVLTGGPGAGKTAVLELIRQSFCKHVKILQEAAGVIFGGGFVVESTAKFLDKAAAAIEIVRSEVPECCKRHGIN
jgi:broad-specificity NMP kinase